MYQSQQARVPGHKSKHPQGQGQPSQKSRSSLQPQQPKYGFNSQASQAQQLKVLFHFKLN